MKLRLLFILIFCFTNSILSHETTSEKEAMMFFNKANTYLFEKKDSESAMKYYILSIEKNTSYPQAHFNLGIARAYAAIQMNDYQAAKSDLLLASDLLPEIKEIQTDLEVLEILVRDSR